MLARERARQPRHQPLRLLDVGMQNLDYGGDIHLGMIGVPAVVVGDHGDGRVADLGLAGELGLRHVGHADDIAAPLPVKVRFGPGRELRALHDDVSAAARQADGLGLGRRLDCVGERRTDRIGERNVRDAPGSEKALLARERPVDELVDENEMARRVVCLQ